MSARWLILGGTGFVGSALCERLARQRPDLRLVLPSRHPQRLQGVRHLPMVEPIVADLHDDATLDRLLAGCTAVVNLVAILHGSQAAFEQVHVALPGRLSAACQRTGVRRMVHVSALGVADDAPSRYLRSKARGEAVLRAAPGLDLTLLRPSVIFGAGDRLLNLFAAMQAVAPVVPLAVAHARFQPVWVGDVAEAIVRAMDRRDSIGRTIECAGPQEVTLATLVRLAGVLSGHPRTIVPLPAALGWLQALALECLPGEPLMSRDNLASARVPNVASGLLPGLDSLGITPASLAAIVPTYLRADASCGRLDAWRARHR
jgi:uncharacterized protein YbjT (DUF2867 family)